MGNLNQKQDLREYSENELSLWVFNDEWLYNQRHSRSFLILIYETFEYTADQLRVLIEDLDADAAEVQNG